MVSILVRSFRLISLRSVTLATQRVSVSTESKLPTQLVKKDQHQTDVESVPVNELVEVTPLSGLPERQINRLARIYVRSRNAMQSGTDNTHKWTLEFDNQERWENPLMGWTSSGDPLSNVTMSFNTKEEAVAFAVKNGWTYQVSKPQKLKMISKSYGANFSWDKKTRVSSK